MRARTLLSALVLAAAVAGCGRQAVTGLDAAGGARRTETTTTGGSTTGGTTSGTTTQSGYLGSGNRTDSTSTEPITPTQP